MNYNLSQRLNFEPQRSLAFGSISGTYAGIGTSLNYPAVQFLISNLTDADLQFSIDGVTDHFPLIAGAQWINDNRANRSDQSGGFYLGVGTRLYVKTLGGAPGSGAVYFSVVYGVNT